MSSRRHAPGADKAAANQAVIKQLLKLPGNKYCADCKRNKLPRWASWNLGIFICIRCSGIHRGMGTHISRVKSVDLDSWTDEQLASMVKWGNTRANKYWEANLAPGHVPSEAKIENFIRTKYDSKRWVMPGPIPDPATLGDDEEDENMQLDSRKAATAPSSTISTPAPPPAAASKKPVNLFDDDDEPEVSKPAQGSLRGVATKAEPAPPKSSKPGDSLLGLDDFFSPAAQDRPSSVNSNPATGGAKSNRPDLKTSILSLYSSPQVRKPQHQSTGSFGAPQMSPVMQQQQQQSMGGGGGGGFGDFNDAFAGLNFNSTPQQQQQQQPQITQQPPKPASNAFANLTSPLMSRSPAAAPQVTPAPVGGFFGSSNTQKKPGHISSSSTSQASAGLNDLFSLSSSSFSQPQQQPKPAPVTNNFAFDNAWSTPSAAAPVSTQTNVWGSSNTDIASNAFAGLGTSSLGGGGGGNNKNHIAADDDFGAFTAGGSIGGGGGSAGKMDDDLFANVWK